MEGWLERQSLFNLALAKDLPLLRIENVSVREVEADTYEVEVAWKNEGKLPTALEQAKLVKIVQEDRVQLRFDSELTRGYEEAKVQIVSPEVMDKTIYAGYTDAGERKTVRFRVRLQGVSGAEATVRLLSTRGGQVEQKVKIGR
ncbi:hypothetical protein [Nitritalea halalkaliphila]|uniref:hypothetical protein n=1 Tax=Nitritalea halalkaliphila TaxID=590849 RepID=UPI00293473A0|nr:hypothetical protein [Nitritalea halalkaliphila]